MAKFYLPALSILGEMTHMDGPGPDDPRSMLTFANGATVMLPGDLLDKIWLPIEMPSDRLQSNAPDLLTEAPGSEGAGEVVPVTEEAIAHALDIIQRHIDDVTGDSDQEPHARRAYAAVSASRFTEAWMRDLRDALDDSETLETNEVKLTEESAARLNANVDAWLETEDVGEYFVEEQTTRLALNEQEGG